MKIFFNVQSNELMRESAIISIGMCSENNKYLYAEFNDIDFKTISPFVRENVFKATINVSNGDNIINKFEFSKRYPSVKPLVGTKYKLRPIILNWLNQFNDIELVSDVGHYGLVFLIDILFDNAIGADFITYYDVNQLIADSYNISTSDAFNISRKDFLSEKENEDLKWNALYKADQISQIYKNLLEQKGAKENGKKRKK